MQENNNQKTISNSKTADNGAKLIFENPTLCSQLLRDYSGIELLKDVKPEDIEDITERFIPMFTEERDADVVKKVHIRGGEDVIIALIEHKSSVDYNVIMQVLRYMVYIWEDYEKQQNKENDRISGAKNFKYPPIIPVVYYEGRTKWDAAMKLSDRVVLSDVFEGFIPDFRYHLISLGDFGRQDLLDKRNELSFVMLINSLKSAEDFKNIDFPEGYLDNIQKNSPSDVLDTIARVIAVVLRKQNVPENEIWEMVDQIKERKSMGLWDDWEGFDVQAERNIGRMQGREEGKEQLLVEKISKKYSDGKDAETIADELDEPSEYVKRVINAIKEVGSADDVYLIIEKMKTVKA